MGHAKSIITVDTYTDMQAIIEDCEEEIQEFIKDVHPYDSADVQILKEMFQEEVDLQEDKERVEKDNGGIKNMIIPMLKRWMILTNGIWERGSESASFFLSIFGNYMQKEADKSMEEKFFNFPLVFICFFWYN